MLKELFIKNTDIVTVSLYTSRYQFELDKNPNEHSFDSATISFTRNENKPRKRCIRNNRLHIKRDGNLVSKIALNMSYDMAMQFLRKLSFSPIIDEAASYNDRNGEPIFMVNEYWDSKIDNYE